MWIDPHARGALGSCMHTPLADGRRRPRLGIRDMSGDARTVLRIAAVAAGLLLVGGACGSPRGPARFRVSFPASVRSEPLTGRVYVAIARGSAPEPRYAVGSLGAYFRSAPFF